ncbi:AbrB/MazE/SpoVT family DNA-binding domain-containing protein [Rugamonas rivuli]|uniref:PbsX family transcriptional regulator n=1 Tax=Rugamonas rivuli TaxID=2743358 RepID=A0A843SIU8_9BURK|nr:PbsX family transcriptional regulator [Rugamonas rivuli]MQA21884.1 PbsX family transcriptional regulator [Rugamonas rivuli]
MELSIQKWGNSAAVRLPTELLGILKVVLGDKLSVSVLPEGVLLKAARPSYSLDELVTQCDTTSPEPADMAAWHNAKPVGREAW